MKTGPGYHQLGCVTHPERFCRDLGWVLDLQSEGIPEVAPGHLWTEKDAQHPTSLCMGAWLPMVGLKDQKQTEGSPPGVQAATQRSYEFLFPSASFLPILAVCHRPVIPARRFWHGGKGDDHPHR